MTTDARRALLLSGSTRVGSTNTAVLRTLASMAPPWVTAVLYAGLSALPAFNPDDSASGLPRVDELLHDIRAADIVVICTPEYAGSLPGSFKNLLDWTVGGQEVESSVGWINVSTAATGARGTHESLRAVLGYTGAHVVDSACRNIPVRRDMVNSMGDITNPAVRAQVSDVLVELVRHATAGASA